MKTKGIVLAGGLGTRLGRVTKACLKQLLPVYDKPMIDYPLSTLITMGIEDILLISTPHDLPKFEQLYQDGRRLGINMTYLPQSNPKGGIAEAIKIGKNHIQDSDCCLILGDNIFYGDHDVFTYAMQSNRGATIFGFRLRNKKQASEYGVMELDSTGKVLSLQEKPEHPLSDLAVPGIYIYDSTVYDRVKELQPSARGELEITDLNKSYLPEDLRGIRLRKGFVWLDAGTENMLLSSSNFVQSIEERTGIKVGCVEQAALYAQRISPEQLVKQVLEEQSNPQKWNNYQRYLVHIAEEHLDSKHI